MIVLKNLQTFVTHYISLTFSDLQFVLPQKITRTKSNIILKMLRIA